MQHTILVVEDEPAVLAVIVNALEREGYRVLQARHGYDAIALASGDAEQIQLVITDIGLPGLDGLEVAERILRICPHTQFVLMSGHLDPAALAGYAIGSRAAFLRKPFRRADLLAVVRPLLSGPRVLQ